MPSKSKRSEPPETDEPLTRGHKKKARTRQQLVDTAVRLFGERGGQDLSLNRLADEAGVSHGTVYNYFTTREELLEAVGLALADRLSHEIVAFSVGTTRGAERLAFGVRSFVRKAQADSEWGHALVRVVRYGDALRTALAEYMRADLRAGVEQGDFSFASEELAMALVAAGTIAAIAALLEGHAVAQHDSAVAEMLLRALGVPAAKARAIAHLPMPSSRP